MVLSFMLTSVSCLIVEFSSSVKMIQVMHINFKFNDYNFKLMVLAFMFALISCSSGVFRLNGNTFIECSIILSLLIVILI